MVTRINRYLLLAFGLKNPIKSILHIANGHGDVKLNRGAEGALSYHYTPTIYGIL
jgi:hypothetical protein